MTYETRWTSRWWPPRYSGPASAFCGGSWLPFLCPRRFCDPAGRLVQDARAAGVPDGAAAAPFRAGGLGGNDDRDPVLADFRHVRGAWPRSEEHTSELQSLRHLV